jgi:hypothetical protein
MTGMHGFLARRVPHWATDAAFAGDVISMIPPLTPDVI